VVIFRYNTGAGVGGRSGCMSCGAKLRWFELVPVFSFLIQKARCRNCKTKLSWQYPLVEFATGLLFLFSFFHIFNGQFSTPISSQLITSLGIMLITWCLLVIMIVYDFRHKIIPDGIVYSFALLGLIRVLIETPYQPTDLFIWTLLSGPILFTPFYLLWKVSQGRWIGLGDGKLALGIGWMLGLGLGVSAIFIAFWIGAIVSVIVVLVGRLKIGKLKLTMKSEIPFAPYLVLGFLIAYFGAIDVIGLHALFGL
jgi:prepilin signal peptidase PulO-like enzyme (type II secretory pathway)